VTWGSLRAPNLSLAFSPPSGGAASVPDPKPLETPPLVFCFPRADRDPWSGWKRSARRLVRSTGATKSRAIDSFSSQPPVLQKLMISRPRRHFFRLPGNGLIWLNTTWVGLWIPGCTSPRHRGERRYYCRTLTLGLGGTPGCTGCAPRLTTKETFALTQAERRQSRQLVRLRRADTARVLEILFQVSVCPNAPLTLARSQSGRAGRCRQASWCSED
jgi:hypothetical protein